jgi:Phytanoyl-CoA dioxygenase (PhyH)
MIFGATRRLSESVERLNRAVARDVSPAALDTLALEHPHPRRMREIFSRLLAFEADPQRYNAHNSHREQQRYNHRCDYQGAELVSRALSLFFERYELEHAERYDASLVAEQAHALAAQGYSLLPRHLPAAVSERISTCLGAADIAFREDLSGKIHYGYRPETVAATTANVCRVVDQSALLACPDIAALATDPNIIAIAQRFLGAPPVHTQVNAWWSVRHSEEHEHASVAAQKFHQDRDYIKFVKVFIYLTDVGEANGPHQFIAGSNTDYAQVSGQKYRSSKRREDAELLAKYGRERLRVFTAPRGTVLFEDTSGFHKGTPVASGHRMLLQLEYVSTLYGSPPLALSGEALQNIDPAVRGQYPRFTSAYGFC